MAFEEVTKVAGFVFLCFLITVLREIGKSDRPPVEPQYKGREESRPALREFTPLPSCWSTLGIPPTRSIKDIRQAYRRLAHENHPDKHGGDKVQEEKMKRINEAYREALRTVSQP